MQRRGPDYYNHQPGWSTTSRDYHSHVKNMERMQSVLPDVPHYPNFYVLFNNKMSHPENPQLESQVQQKPKKPESHKKAVQFVEPEKPKKMESHKKVVQFIELEKTKVVEKHEDVEVCRDQGIDAYADGFIQNKHKMFELCKWASFRS